MKCFIAAHYNLNNGDRAVLEATIQQILKFNEKNEIVVSAFEPDVLVDGRVKIVSWPIKKNRINRKIFRILQGKRFNTFLKIMYRFLCDINYLYELRQSDVVFISGGHHLTDILGKNTYYSLACNYLIPIYEHKKIILLPQSIGPIAVNTNEYNNAKYILSNVNRIFYRDDSSKVFLKNMEIPTNFEYCPDLVFSIQCENKQIRGKKRILGIAPYCSYQGVKRDEVFPFVQENLQYICERYLKDGWGIRFISMEDNDLESSSKIVNLMRNKGFSDIEVEKCSDDSVLGVINLFSNKDIILAYKTHSVVFSIINNVPLLAIAYHEKSKSFMDSINLGDYVINDNEADETTIVAKINEIDRNIKSIKELESVGLNNLVVLINGVFSQLL